MRRVVGTVFLAGALVGSAFGQSTKPNLTSDQIEAVHSRLSHSGEPGAIPRLVAETPYGNQVHINCPAAIVDEIWFSGPSPYANLLFNLTSMTRGSDLVIVGKVGVGTTHPYADQSFLYTDWKMTVEQIVKNNSKAPVESGQMITVTRPGGVLHVDGRLVVADCANFIMWGTGHEYLLYLHYLPKTGAYSIGNGLAAFEFLDDKTARRLDMVNKREEPDVDTLLNLAQEAVSEAAKPIRAAGGQQ